MTKGRGCVIVRDMETTKREEEMFGYTFSVVKSDTVFGTAVAVVTVDAESIPAAAELAACEPNVLEVGHLLCTIDRKPQVFLAW